MRKVGSLVLLLGAVACLWLGGLQHGRLASARFRRQAAVPDSLENAPPLMMFTTVVLGGFRGLIADVLWMRAAYLQDQSNYFELVQLADWITKLEPHSAEVWAFHAWNLAYNVSVMMPDDEDRWRWVTSGVRLLRDEGIAYNPTDPELYKELAWIFMHKIGKTADAAHEYYKRKWAEEMRRLLGGPYPEYDRLAARPDLQRKMREEYGLLPEIMKTLEAKYGRIDWTKPEAHSLYWAYRGSQMVKGKGRKTCDIIVRQSVRVLFGGESEDGTVEGHEGHNLGVEHGRRVR